MRGTENDDKIFREVNALSRLNHRNIVRYYATWLETVDRHRRSRRGSSGGWDSGDDDDDEDTTDSDTTASRKKPKQFDEDNMLGYDLDDLTLHSRSRSGRSFPSIHFGEETSSMSMVADDDDDDEGESSDTEEEEEEAVQIPSAARPKPVPRILYIQMVSLRESYWLPFLIIRQEFVDKQTLREVRG